MSGQRGAVRGGTASAADSGFAPVGPASFRAQPRAGAGAEDRVEAQAAARCAALLARVCAAPGCGAALHGLKATARYCDDTCRKRAARARQAEPDAPAAEGRGNSVGGGVRAPADPRCAAQEEGGAPTGGALFSLSDEGGLVPRANGGSQAPADGPGEVAGDGGARAVRRGEGPAAVGWTAPSATAAQEAVEQLRHALAAMADRQDLLELSQAEGLSQLAAAELDDLRAKLAAQTARASAAEGKLAALTERFAGVEARLGGVERAQRPTGASRAEASAARLDALERQIGELRAEVAGLGRRAGGATGRDRELQDRVKSLEGEVAAVVRMVEQIVEAVV